MSAVICFTVTLTRSSIMIEHLLNHKMSLTNSDRRWRFIYYLFIKIYFTHPSRLRVYVM